MDCLERDMALTIKVNLKNVDILQEIKNEIKNEVSITDYSVIKTKPLKVSSNGTVDTGFGVKGSIISAQLLDIAESDLDVNGNLRQETDVIVEDILPLSVSGSVVSFQNAIGRYVVLIFLAGDE
jgi:hypothetical protein